ncbi:MAG: hypothetical protein QXP55_03640 [Nitrososphaerales archaeon]
MIAWNRLIVAIILSFLASLALGWIFFVFTKIYFEPFVSPVIISILLILLFFILFFILSILIFVYESP